MSYQKDIWTKERKEKLSKLRIGENNPNWKGDAVKYGALHDYIKWHLPKSKLCDECKKTPPYDLANKGIYDRDFKNWEWLCRKCHMKKDGRLEKWLKRNRENILQDKNCLTCKKLFHPHSEKTKFCSLKCRPPVNWKGGFSLDIKAYRRRMRYHMKKLNSKL